MFTTEEMTTAQRIPIYEKVESDIRDKIRSGFWRPGTLLPSRRNLAVQYGVGLITVERAVANLLADGTLEAQDRRGTFVAKRGITAEEVTGAQPEGDKRSDRSLAFVSVPSAQRQISTPLGLIVPVYSEYDTEEALNQRLSDTHWKCSSDMLWTAAIASSLESTFCARGGSPIHFANHNAYTKGATSLKCIITTMLNEGVGAFVINSVYGTYEDLDLVEEAMSALVSRPEVPLVFITSREIPDPVYQVFFDHRYAGYQAVEHLLQRGYRRLLYLRPFTEPWSEERLEGARAAVRHAGLDAGILRSTPSGPIAWGSASVVERDRAVADAFNELRSLLAAGSGPLAIIAPNDGTAFRFLALVKAAGLVPGKDFGIIGFDDDLLSRGLGLSTFRAPLEELGAEAANLVFGSLTGEQVRRQVRLNWRLIARTSTSLASN